MPFAVTTSGLLSGQQLSANSLSATSLWSPDRPLGSLSSADLIRLLADTDRPATQKFAERYGGFRLATPWFHTLWYAAYDNDEWPAVYVQGPREHAKTSTVLTYAKRRLAECQHTRVGVLSGTDALAKKFMNEIKYDLAYNEALSRDFNDGRTFIGDKWTEHEITLANARSTKPCRDPQCKGPISGKDVSVFAASRGSQVSSRHCDILIVDDPENADSVRSEEVREATREWWSREVVSVLSPGGKLIVAGTRKHYDDLYSRFIVDPEFHVLDQAKQVFLPDGSPIWPEMWSIEALLARKAKMDSQDLLAWPQEMLNEPRPAGTQMFFPERWPTYTKAPWGLSIIQCWDLAISEKTTADYTCGWTIGLDEQNNVFILERRKGHWDFNRTLAEIEDMGKKWASATASGTLAAIGIEQVAYQAAAVQEAMRRTMLPIVPYKPDKDKVVRARLLEARAAANKVVRPADASWWADFVPEAEFFPDGAHDDQIDALSGAVRMAGWQADTIGFAYGVWTCLNCSHMFTWDPDRPCPKCGTKAPASFENPETMSYGNLGERMDMGPLIEYGDMSGGREAPTFVKANGAERQLDPAIANLGRPRTLLTAEQQRIHDLITTGKGLGQVDGRTYRGSVRGELQTVAAWFADSGQDVKAVLALEEVRRLDNLHGVQP
jgi:predicted phage terminase large subunit-like protein